VRLRPWPDSPLEAAALAVGEVPVPLFEAFVGYVQARAIIAGSTLGIFRALDERPDDAAGLAARLELDPLGAATLLVALHTTGYLDVRDGRYAPSAVTRKWLLPGAARTLEPYLGAFNADMWEWVSGLEAAVRTGRGAGLHAMDRDDPRWLRYMRGLFALARFGGADVAWGVDAGAPRRMLDLAGGHGGFAIALCDRHPGLRATVLDLEPAVAAGRELVREHGYADRVDFTAGDLFEADYGSNFDLVFCGQIVHHLAPADAVELLRRARSALRPGGIVAVYEQEAPPPGERGHQLGVLVGLLFFATSAARTYGAGEVGAFLGEAGFRDIRIRRPRRLPGTFVARAVA
jgi:SAM-dependent methyltransferase